MNTKLFATRVFGFFGLGVAAFASGAAVAPAPAGAHCGGHAYSCGLEEVYSYSQCELNGSQNYTWHDHYNTYVRECSGTCYGGAGCCISAEACADSPCKPGGCGSACAYDGEWRDDTGVPC